MKKTKSFGEPAMVTVNCPDEIGIGCDICCVILEFSLCIIDQYTKDTPLPRFSSHEGALHQRRRLPPPSATTASPISHGQFPLTTSSSLPITSSLSLLWLHLLLPTPLSQAPYYHRLEDLHGNAGLVLTSPALSGCHCGEGIHQFDWFTRGRVPVLEAMEKDRVARSQFRGGSSAIVASTSEKPVVVAAKLQALSPKYNSLMNHIRIHLPELFPSLNKLVFLDDDIVVQADLSPLWDIDLEGKVNGAVETCRGDDKFVMSKRLKSYLNFSHPIISESFDPNECAWAYGMNIFDLEAWRKTNISLTYHHWLQKNLKSDLSLWQLGTLPPGLIAFHGHVQIIDPYWHMLGLGYQDNTTLADAQKAAVIHFNGRAKPWLDIGFMQLRPLWTKYVDFNDKFIRGCNIRA